MPTRREPLTERLHGIEIEDPYRWLERADAPEVEAWVDDQDREARRYLEGLPQRAGLADRLEQVLYYDALGLPVRRGKRTFWGRKHRDKEKSAVFWRERDGAERVLLDPNEWSRDGSVALGGYWPTWDGERVAYSRKENNSDESVTYVMDVATGRLHADVLPGTKYSGASWNPEGNGFYYTWVPPISETVSIADRPGYAELRFHRLGTHPAEDPVLFPATKDPTSFLGGGISRDGHWLFAVVRHGWSSTDVYFRSVSASEWTPLVVGVGALFEVFSWNDRFYVLTNEGAPRFRLFGVDPARPEREFWQLLVPESPEPGTTLQDVELLGGRLFLSYLKNASSALEVRELDGRKVGEVKLPGLGTVTGISGLPEETQAYFAFSSFTQPSVLYELSTASLEAKEWARVELPIDTGLLTTEQVRYPSEDGTEVSMFLLRRKDAIKRGDAPTLLYGYGGFSVSMTPGFSPSWAVWLERGGMVAIPNLRGGGEYGEAWHQDGMGSKKQNVFDDFLAAARFLCDEGWTRPSRLAIWGGSNGGLLVGAAMTQAPEQFGAVICAVPLLDMVRYTLFGSGKTWISEYGSPDNPGELRVLHAYSPYHRLREGQQYPPFLMLASDHDDRVDPMHARKFIARLQHDNAARAPALLRVERNAGHGGADLVRRQVGQNADAFAFLLDVMQAH